jgi:hypothetical protein
MSLNYTTIVGAVTPNATSFSVTSATGITSPVFNTGSGITYILCDQELMLVTNVNGVVVNVQRGVGGTRAMNHNALAPILSGLPADFLGFKPAIQAFSIVQPEVGFMMPGPAVASAASIICPSAFFHVTGSASITNMQPPTSALLSYTGSSTEENYVNGTRITIIADGTASFAAGGGGTGVAIAGAVAALTAGTAIDFILDGSLTSQLWYPLRKG